MIGAGPRSMLNNMAAVFLRKRKLGPESAGRSFLDGYPAARHVSFRCIAQGVRFVAKAGIMVEKSLLYRCTKGHGVGHIRVVAAVRTWGEAIGGTYDRLEAGAGQAEC